MVFQKPSLRTRVSFEVGMLHLGGSAIMLGPSEIGLGKRESIADVSRVLSGYVQCIMARVFDHQHVIELAKYARVPVINGLSDDQHPCQALADMLTLREHWGGWAGRTLAYVGDGNNVAHSLMLDAARLGMHFRCITPAGYEPAAEIVEAARGFAAATGARIEVTSEIEQGLMQAEAVYTDVWASMGQEHEAIERARLFAPYQVNEALMAMAAPGALFMHCLPAHREEETTDAVMESRVSVVFDQAENRLHAQKALMVMLAAQLH